MNHPTFFRSSGFLEEAVIHTESGEYLDLEKIPNFLRTLLVTDGTVTKSLEAWFWEPVNVIPKSNILEVLKSEVKGLEVDSGDKVLQREVILKGQNSNKVYASARSMVSLKHLPLEVGEALEKGEIGIGELLREKGIETYRDIFNINYLSRNDDDEMLALLSSITSAIAPSETKSEKILTRSYRIRVNGQAAIIVTEFFPVDIYQ